MGQQIFGRRISAARRIFQARDNAVDIQNKPLARCGLRQRLFQSYVERFGFSGHGYRRFHIDDTGGLELAMQAKLSDRLQFRVIETLEHLSFPDESFAGCICLSVIEYLDRPYQCLDELARVLEPGGTLIVSVPHTYSPIRLAQALLASILTRSNSSKWHYRLHSNFSTTQQELRKSFARRGLRLRKIVGFDAVLPRFLLSYCPPSLMFAIATKTDSAR
jgi:SAM-dependent methyltransferase